MFCDREVRDATALMSKDHQDEQEAARRGRNHEEICGHHLSEVIRQERAPCLGRRRPIAHHVCRDRRLTALNSKFQQFAVDPRSAPQRVGLRHRANQRPDSSRHCRPTGTATALPGPEQPEASAVPGDHRLRCDDDERPSPPGPDAGQPNPEPTVRLREPQPPRPRSLQHLQLVPQRQHLELVRGVQTRRSS